MPHGTVTHKPTDNHLLEALPEPILQRLMPQLKLVPMELGKVLYESGDTLRFVYFPTDCIVSLLYVLQDGASAEISVVGNEGLIGIALFMGGETTPSRAIVQSAGNAFRMPGQVLKDEFHRDPDMQLLLLRYTQSLITQMAQTAVCNRHHSVDQQLCRWLLPVAGPTLVQPADDDPGTDRQHAGRASRGRHRGRRQAAESRCHRVQARLHHRDRPAAPGTALLRVLCRRQEGNRPTTCAAGELNPSRGP